jgi:hypothetical protein
MMMKKIGVKTCMRKRGRVGEKGGRGGKTRMGRKRK